MGGLEKNTVAMATLFLQISGYIMLIAQNILWWKLQRETDYAENQAASFSTFIFFSSHYLIGIKIW